MSPPKAPTNNNNATTTTLIPSCVTLSQHFRSSDAIPLSFSALTLAVIAATAVMATAIGQTVALESFANNKEATTRADEEQIQPQVDPKGL